VIIVVEIAKKSLGVFFVFENQADEFTGKTRAAHGAKTG
jgi:hypothetical protein